MNVRQAVLDNIIKHGPEHFNMREWFIQNGNEYALPYADVINIDDCRTTACIAGFTALVCDDVDTVDSARKALGLDSESLFYCSEWPLYADQLGEYEGAIYLLTYLVNNPEVRDI